MKQSYNPALDGIRAIAVTAVMLNHACNLYAGFIGVDIFFVLSGFLITSVLHADYVEGRNLNRFYRRRFLRIVPALAFMCLVLILCAPFLDMPEVVEGDVISTLFWVSNWTKAFGLMMPHYIGHTWSLSIEEQFYLTWPILFFAVLKRGGEKSVAIIACILIVACGAWRFELGREGASIRRIFGGFDTHCDGLLIGACLAICRLQPEWPKFVAWANRIWIVPALFLGFALTTTSIDWMMAGGWTLINIAAGMLIAAACQTDGRLFRFLSCRPLVAFGKISYSFYLWHYLVFTILLEKGLMRPVMLPPYLLLSFSLSTLSYWMIERPCMALGHSQTVRFPVNGIHIAMASACVCVLGTGLILAHIH